MTRIELYVSVICILILTTALIMMGIAANNSNQDSQKIMIQQEIKDYKSCVQADVHHTGVCDYMHGAE